MGNKGVERKKSQMKGKSCCYFFFSVAMLCRSAKAER